MASKNVDLSTTAYTKLDTGTGTAIDCQNTGSSVVRVIFAAAEPAADAKAYYKTKPGQGVVRNGHADDMWAISETGAGSKVTVGE